MPSVNRVQLQKLRRAIAGLDLSGCMPLNLMEVCGSHTMAIAKAGIRSMLPEKVKLLSGPGCPVCVTPPEEIDNLLELSARPGVIIATYGDMLRVPGSIRGDSLRRRSALGAEIRVVYSAVDAVAIARENPTKDVVFLGVGFETTAPGTAAAVLTAAEQGIQNFYLYSMLKAVEPALRVLTGMADFDVQGFLCPGHVASILGEKGFAFLSEELGYASVISGFEAGDILFSIFLLLKQLQQGKPLLQNEYRRAVAPEGNPAAMAMLDRCFERRPTMWRGLGMVENSGYFLNEELRQHDAAEHFGIAPAVEQKVTACCCGRVITGSQPPMSCPLFGKVCTPEDPVGPCMVSSEGACAAAYKYGPIL